MLQELRVENLLLIEAAELRLAPGLNVLTGETGAGKTVLAHALDLLLGGRARSGIVRPGASEAYVEGVFELTPELRSELGERLSSDAEDLVLARRVGADGRTRAYVNGRSASAKDLRELGGAVLAFYGQHEHRKLTLASEQLTILDGMCGPGHEALLDACARALGETRSLQERMRELAELAGRRERELDLLQFELSEIDALAPDEQEHEQLLAARDRLRAADSLRSAAGAAAEALAPDGGESPGVAALAAEALTRLGGVSGADPALDALMERARTLAIEAGDLAGDLRVYCDGNSSAGAEIDRGPLAGAGGSLDALEERLAALERVARKHGGSIVGALEYASEARARHEELVGADEALAEAESELQRAREDLELHVTALRKARKAAASALEPAVRDQLAALAMGDARFEIVLAEAEAGPRGGDSVEFLLAPNPGVPAGPIREIASGGELSRVMLAIMSVAGASAQGATLVFDEVDAGIGGHTARAVGARLRELGTHRQVLCITHLAQIASLGARHFTIIKDTGADPTLATVAQLGEGEVVGELVRMLGADSDDSAALSHAQELRRAA